MSKAISAKTIIFYAPIGNLTKGFRSGGAEAGCRKTIEVLKKAGHRIILVEKPARKSASKLDGLLLAVKSFAIWLKLIYLFINHRGSILHVAGFYLKQIYTEWFFLGTARLLGIKTIYEVRNGGMVEDYYSGSSTYRYFMQSVLVNASLVLCQGYEYVVFLKEKLNKDSVLYSNYIMDDFITANDDERENEKLIKLIYFGRVVADKNVDFIMDVCKEAKRLNLNISLDVIGAYEESYHQLLTQKAIQNNIVNDVIFYGRMDFKDIYKYLKASHFFIFPSKEKREGHSNSLTEAMGCGVVPIVSTAGFNESIVGDPELVIANFNAEEYAYKIAAIWNNGSWKSYSESAYNRIAQNFTESIISKVLLKAYDDL